jgi:hypothetical protein
MSKVAGPVDGHPPAGLRLSSGSSRQAVRQARLVYALAAYLPGR